MSVLLIFLGATIIAFSLIYAAVGYFENLFLFHRFGMAKKIEIPEWLRAQLGDMDTNILVIGGVIGGLIGLVLVKGSHYILQGTASGAMIAMGAIYVVGLTRNIHKANLRRKECYILFDAIGLYMEADYGLRKALSDSSKITHELKPAIIRCLNYWSAGPINALKIFEKEIGLSEGNVLVSLLIQYEKYGAQSFEGSLRRETLRMERLRTKKERGKVPYKTLYLTVYQFLPVFAVFGLVAGAVYVYSVGILSSAGITLFK